MADIRKEQERDELHRAIWAIADELRGSVDGWDFKSYVLGMMFYRYISENLTNYINEGEIEAGEVGFDYAQLSDEDAEQAREDLVKTKGFFILPSELFCNVRKRAANDENLNMTLEAAFNHIEESAKGSESEDNFAGLFDDIDVNSNKLGTTVAKRNANLVKLIEGVANMGLGNYKDNSIDAFGDAYEYLMSMYASNAGKSGGEFFTPQEVSELLTRMAVAGKTEVNKVYDPACGSGSLLLKAAKILGKENVRQGFYGQEINLTTYNLCRINMFLHDIDFDKFDIAHEDTLLSPQHWDDEPFEVIVSNPPYSIKWEGDDNPVLINDPRFSPAGVLAPKSKADLAFIMHSLAWLATNGTAAIVCFPGIMYRGGAEKKIRQYLIDNNFIDCIIQLPSNLFFGTSIATCIMVLKRSKADNRTLFIDASKEFVKVTNNNRLTEENIAHIVDEFISRNGTQHFSHLANYDEIKAQDYNLSVSTYEERIAELLQKYPLGQPIVGEKNKKDFIVLFGNILRLRNILAAFDRFAGNEILSPIDFQDYTGTYHDVYEEIKPKPGSKESIMDDVVFEMELVKQVEVNIDYILMLVGKYHDGNCEDKEILVAIDKAIKSSLQLRSKKELIENFIATINTNTNVNTDWQRFVREQRETDIQTLITEEKLKPEETRKFVENAFRDGVLKTTGTDVDRLMPPVSRFGGGGSRDKKKQTVIEKLKGFFEKYFGLVSPEVSKEPDKVTYLYDTEPTLSMVAEEPVHYGMKKDN